MSYSNFIDEIYNSIIISTEGAIDKYLPFFAAHREGRVLTVPDLPPLAASFFDSFETARLKKLLPEETQDSVAVVPVKGFMSRSGSWWDYGTDEISEKLKEMYANEAVKAIVLRINTNGGTTDSIIPMKDALAKKNKPVFAAVDNNALSAGYFMAALTDKVYAVDPMAEVGSIGVMTQFFSYKKYYEELGIKVITVRAKQSGFKNLEVEEAEKGKPERLMEEMLNPWAQHFQDTVKEHRKKLDMNVEGLLEGRVFYAFDAVKNGLVDDIMPMDEIVKVARDYDKIKKLSNYFK